MTDILELPKNEPSDSLSSKAETATHAEDVVSRSVEKHPFKAAASGQAHATDISDLLEVTKNEELHDTLITKADNTGQVEDAATKTAEKDAFKPFSPRVHPTGLTEYEVDIQRQIIVAFQMFDLKKLGKVAVRDVGSIIRSLGMCPTENEVYKLIMEVEEEEERPGYIHLTNLLPVLTKAVVENRFQPSSKERLLQAFKTVDQKKKGYLTKDEISNLLSDHGEPLAYEELEKFIDASIEEGRTRFYYMKFIDKLLVPKMIPL